MTTNGIRILHLEDNTQDAELVGEGLRRAGIQCGIDQVRSKEGFVRGLKERRYDLVISDFSMAGFDGQSALKMSRDLRPGLPFIFYSGTPHEEAIMELLKQGATDIIPKGRIDDLAWAVKKTITRQIDSGFKNVFDKAPQAFFIADRQGRIVYTNQKAERIVRRSTSEMTAMNIEDLLSEEGRRTWSMVMEQLSSVKEVDLEVLVRRNRKGFFEADLSVSLISDRQILVVMRDGTDRISLEKRLRTAEESFRSLAEQAGDIVFSVSPDGRVSFLSSTFSKITGWSEFVWLGNDLSPILHPDDVGQLQYNLEYVLKGGRTSPFRLRIRRTDGEYFEGECTSFPLFQRNAVAGVWIIVRAVEELSFADNRPPNQLN